MSATDVAFNPLNPHEFAMAFEGSRAAAVRLHPTPVLSALSVVDFRASSMHQRVRSAKITASHSGGCVFNPLTPHEFAMAFEGSRASAVR